MRTVDAILSAAMLAGSGDPLARITVNAVTYNLIAYKWNNMRFECTIEGTVSADYQDVLTATRGMQVDGTEYLVSIGSFFIEILTLDIYGITHISAHALPHAAVTEVDGNDDALAVLNVIGALNSVTFKGYPSIQDWLDTWEFLKAGQTISLVSVKLLEGILRTKRSAYMAARYDGIYVTNPPSDEANYSSSYAITLPEDTDYTTIRLQSRNIIWEDENNFKYNNYEAGGVAPAGAPKFNIGYINSSVSANAVGTLGIDGGGRFRFKQFPDLALEQGEVCTTSLSGKSILFFTETFNWPSGAGWYQRAYEQHYQPFSPYGDEPISVTELTTVIEQTINNYITQLISGPAAYIVADTARFNGLLNSSHNTLQAVSDALDDHRHGTYDWMLAQYLITLM